MRAIALATITALGMATATPARAACDDLSAGTVLGTLGGAALGGFLGSRIGSGTGRLAATGGGVFLGALAGNQIGRTLSCNDPPQTSTNPPTTVVIQPDENTTVWRDPDGGVTVGTVTPGAGTVTPTNSYQTVDRRYCREYNTTIYIDGRPERGYARACRQADGTWQVVPW